MADTDARRRGTSGSARRLLSLVLCFTRERPVLTATELAEMCGLSVPTVYRHLAVLRDAGFVVGSDRNRGFHLSVSMVRLAGAAEAADPLIDLADPIMRELAADTGETVLLVRAVDRAATCIHRIESIHPLRTSYEPGQSVAFERGASARILIGAMPTRAQRAIYDHLAAQDPAAARLLKTQVELAAKRGWATSAAEVDAGIWATAAAIRDSDDRVIGALSVPAPMARMSRATKDRILDQVKTAAREVSRRVGDARPS